MNHVLSSEQHAQFLLSYLKEYVSVTGITQKELASKVGIDPANLSRILNGYTSPTLDTLVSILDALELTFSVHRGKLFPILIF